MGIYTWLLALGILVGSSNGSIEGSTVCSECQQHIDENGYTASGIYLIYDGL